MTNDWRNVPIEHKVAFGFGLFLILLLAVSVVAVERMGQMHEVTAQMVAEPMPALKHLSRFETAARQFRTTDYRYVLEISPERRKATIPRFDELERNAQVALISYRETISYREDRAQYDRVCDLWKQYLELHRQFIVYADQSSIADSAPFLNGPMRESFLKVEYQLTVIADWNGQRAVHLAHEANVAYRYSAALVAGLFLAALLTGGVAAWFITRNVRSLIVHISARQKAQDALRAKEQLYRAIVANASDVILILKADGMLSYVSPSAVERWGYSPEWLCGRSVLDFIHPEDRARAMAMFGLAEDEPSTYLTDEFRLLRADNTWQWCEVVASDQSSEPAVAGIVITCRDITERKTFEDQLQHQAFHDPLSGLPNRALFLDRVDRALLRASAQETAVAVMVIDLDNFKVVNDSLGHEAGDEMLMEVAGRLSNCVRPQDTVARPGGDEFTILMEDIEDEREATEAAERIGRVLHAPVTLKGHEVFTTASIGVAVSKDKNEHSGDMLRDADTAMYQAKAAGKALHIVFDSSMNDRATERLELESDLRRAIDNGELRLHYQPIISLTTGKICEVEALVRWDHPVRGLMPPLRFIPLAEETGLILPLGHWVLMEACRHARRWQLEYPSDPPLTISVNLSARQFLQNHLVEEVAAALKRTGLPPTSLKIEITETLMMINPEVTRTKLEALKNLGVRLAVDDFGTGYSSMAYLSRFPLDTLKIDKSFVGGLGEQAEAEAIVRAIITLAKTLNLNVTSEGIETADHLARLNRLGSDLGQGFYFSRPLTDSALEDLFANPDRIPIIRNAANQNVDLDQAA